MSIFKALGFYGYSGELIDKITHERAYYCQAEEPLAAGAGECRVVFRRDNEDFWHRVSQNRDDELGSGA